MNRKVQIGDPPIRILRDDLHKLESLLDSMHRSYARISMFLQQEVLRADIVERPTRKPFVRPGSQVQFTDETGASHGGTLHMPEEGSPPPPDAISILTPAGCALLGLSPGQSITYETVDRREKRITVVKVVEPGVSG
ncbi:GreA/GreB family elongation factor [Niveispirillum sp. KHB5.9]|uniref:GreA/GreB family elongation factor n=1 Tax=Niveispirillum sp. KHB5.9 TaxID=3400269 RepID=UPI003A852186